MPLQRKTYWDTREFHDFLAARARQPFAWGSNDCALFAADAVEAITGTDIAEAFRGKYADEATAFALIQSVTGKGTDAATAVGDAAEWCAQHAGLVEWPYPLLAQRGDLVTVQDAGRLIAGVIHLSGRHAVSVGEDGLKRLPITAVKRAWKI